jgi:uncharacterized protein YneF (UPF0154 family)
MLNNDIRNVLESQMGWTLTSKKIDEIMEEIEENKPQKQYYAECIIIP